MPRKKINPDANVFSLNKRLKDMEQKFERIVCILENMKTNKFEQKVNEEEDEDVANPSDETGENSVDKKAELRQEHVPGTSRIITAVHEILGNDFEVTLNESDETSFMINIFVPDKFDGRDASTKELYPRDVRSVVIPAIGGMNVLRERCKKIKRNIQTYAPAFKTAV